MAMIADQDRDFLRMRFGEELQDPVTVVAFTRKAEGLDQQGLECEFCRETEELLSELAELSEKINVEFREYSPDDQLARNLRIDKVPAVILTTDKISGVRYFGIPGGFEFSSLVEDIVDLSQGRTDLAPEARDRVRSIDRDVHIQVFVTPTCPFCPSAVRTAHQMAIENPQHITADVVEAAEFPHLVSRYGVSAVPTVIVDDKIQFEGTLSDEEFAERVARAAG